MIYQVTYDILPTNTSFYDKVGSFDGFIFFKKEFYVNTKHNKKEVLSVLLKGINKDTESVMVRLPAQYPLEVQKWVDKIKFKEDKEEFEKKLKEQEEQTLKFIDDIEAELERQLKQKESEGIENGESKRQTAEATGDDTVTNCSSESGCT